MHGGFVAIRTVLRSFALCPTFCKLFVNIKCLHLRSRYSVYLFLITCHVKSSIHGRRVDAQPEYRYKSSSPCCFTYLAKAKVVQGFICSISSIAGDLVYCLQANIILSGGM